MHIGGGGTNGASGINTDIGCGALVGTSLDTAEAVVVADAAVTNGLVMLSGVKNVGFASGVGD